jgi:hypothetical protein
MPRARSHCIIGFQPDEIPPSLSIILRAYLPDRPITSPVRLNAFVVLAGLAMSLIPPIIIYKMAVHLIEANGGPQAAPLLLRVGSLVVVLAAIFVPLWVLGLVAERIGGGSPSWVAEEQREAAAAKRRAVR